MTTDLRPVPMFPLPNVVLFPGTVMPLHVFEPRYKELTVAALEGSREIAIAQLRPGWDRDYHGMPPVYRTMTVGEIKEHHELPDGRFDLVLVGQYRARLQEERPTGNSPFRMALLEPLESRPFDFDDSDNHATVEFLQSVFESLLRQKMVPNLEEAVEFDLEEAIQNSNFIDLLAQVFCNNPYDLQGILDELDLNRRARLVEIQVRRQLSRQEGD